MGQTILDEYLANIPKDDDNNLPDPKPFGFSSIATMIAEASEVMEQQAESNRELRRKLDKAEQLAATRIAELEFQMSLKWPGVWQPVVAPSGEKVEMFTDGRVVVLDEDGLYYVYDVDHSEHCMGFGLPEGYAICRKIQPAA